jgi:hypothetical protein
MKSQIITLALCACIASAAAAAETLSNGIVLPDAWPPHPQELTRAPLGEPPYLKQPPAVIPIDVGRQLFVDDFVRRDGFTSMNAKGALYAFWVSPDAGGASHGYVAAGGPGFPGATDTTGK